MKVKKVARTSALTLALAMISTFGLTTVASATPKPADKVNCMPTASLVSAPSDLAIIKTLQD